MLRVPAVFILQSNGWAYSTPTQRQMLNTYWPIASRAAGASRPLRVDGSDAIATLIAIRSAVEQARSGGGPPPSRPSRCGSTATQPTMTAVTWTRHSLERVQRAARPGRAAGGAVAAGRAGDGEIESLRSAAADEVAAGLAEAESSPAPDPAGILDGVYATPLLWSDSAEIAARVRAFVREVVIPAEARDEAGEHGPAPELREELQSAARAAGLFAPHVGTAFGGLGLDVRGQAPVFEEAGCTGLLGPLALNCSAPDQGNIHLLEAVASPEQQERYLRPLASGAVRCGLRDDRAAPGAGSDPAMLLTTARRDGDDWVIDGRKHLIDRRAGLRASSSAWRACGRIRHDEGATMLLWCPPMRRRARRSA